MLPYQINWNLALIAMISSKFGCNWMIFSYFDDYQLLINYNLKDLVAIEGFIDLIERSLRWIGVSCHQFDCWIDSINHAAELKRKYCGFFFHFQLIQFASGRLRSHADQNGGDKLIVQRCFVQTVRLNEGHVRNNQNPLRYRFFLGFFFAAPFRDIYSRLMDLKTLSSQLEWNLNNFIETAV